MSSHLGLFSSFCQVQSYTKPTILNFTAGAFWKKFLIDAGIPVRAAESYTSSFVDNRITEDMVPDLSKVDHIYST